MEDLSPDQEAAVAALARQLDIPEEFLRIPPPVTPRERAEREAAFLRDAQATHAEVVRMFGPQFIAAAGLDPERYELAYELDGGSE